MHWQGGTEDRRRGGRALRRAPRNGQAAQAHHDRGLPRLPAPSSGPVLRRADHGSDRASTVEAYMHAKLATLSREDGHEPPHLPPRPVRFAVGAAGRRATQSRHSIGRRSRDSMRARIGFLQPVEVEAVLRRGPARTSSARPMRRFTCPRSPPACVRASCSRSSGSTSIGSHAASGSWRTFRAGRRQAGHSEVAPAALRPDGRPPRRRARAALPALALLLRRRPGLLPSRQRPTI